MTEENTPPFKLVVATRLRTFLLTGTKYMVASQA